MALNRTETACWVIPNDSASSFCVWLWSSSSNVSILCLRIFIQSEACLQRWNLHPWNVETIPYMIYQLEQCHHKLRASIRWVSAALFFQLKQKIKTSRKCCLVNTKFDISNTVKIKIFVWNSKQYKLNIISRYLTSLKPPKSVVTINHSQQLELSLGKRTELICTPNIYTENDKLAYM